MLEWKAELENVTEVLPEVGTRWYFRLKCPNCGEAPEQWVYVTREEEHDMPGSRGKANYVAKCKFCKRDGSIDLLDAPAKPLCASDEFVPLLTFEARGVEVEAWDPRSGFTCKTVESEKAMEVSFTCVMGRCCRSACADNPPPAHTATRPWAPATASGTRTTTRATCRCRSRGSSTRSAGQSEGNTAKQARVSFFLSPLASRLLASP